jgi:plastocyanin
MLVIGCTPSQDAASDTTDTTFITRVRTEPATVAQQPPAPAPLPESKGPGNPPAAVKTAAPAAPAAGAVQHPDDQGEVIAPKLAHVDTTVTLRANGPELAFDPPTITLKQGTRVRVRFANMGSFAHNFVIVRDEKDIDQIAERAHDASDNVPMSLKSKMITWSNMAQPSQTVETSFVVPPPGDYVYVCLVEGHANTMIGRLRSTP